MHTDRNHSWLPAPSGPPWWHVETFLYLSDVDDGTAPTHLVSREMPKAATPGRGESCRKQDPEPCTRRNDRRPACAARSSRTATTCSTAASTSPRPGGTRYLLAVAFKLAGCDWIGYAAPQSRSTSPDWVAFAESCTPRELELFGFPPPGHPIWNAELLDATAARYPKLDLGPWRASLT